MPQLANNRQESYAQHRAKGMIPAKAALAAGYASGSAIYTGLEKDAEVIARIAELIQVYKEQKEQRRAAALEQAKVVGQITGVNKAWVIEQLAANALRARDEGEYKDSNDALKLIGEEFGMFKGGALADKEDDTMPTIDMDMTEALLNSAERVNEITDESAPKMDMEAVERLISGNKAVSAKDRQLRTGSETDIALTDAVEIEHQPNIEIPQ